MQGYPKDFVGKLLLVRPDARMTASQSLAHEWFTGGARREMYNALYKKAVAGWVNLIPCARNVQPLGRSFLTKVSK